MLRRPPRSPLFPYMTLFRSLRTGVATEWISDLEGVGRVRCMSFRDHRGPGGVFRMMPGRAVTSEQLGLSREIQSDRKSTRLNSSHITISYAVFCLKKKNIQQQAHRGVDDIQDASDAQAPAARERQRTQVHDAGETQQRERLRDPLSPHHPQSGNVS